MKKQNNKLLALYAIGMSAMLILRDLADIGISKYIIMAYALALMTLATYDTLVHMLCFTFPLVCGLPGTYIMLGALVLLVLKRKKINFWQLGMVLFVLVAEVVASFWYPKLDITAIVGYVSFAGIMLFLIHDGDEKEPLLCVTMYLFGAALLCGIIMIDTLMDAPSDWMTRFARGAFRFGETYTEDLSGIKLSLNANSLAYYSVTGIACGIFCAENSKGWKKLLLVLLAVLFAIVGFLTISRSWLLVAAISLLLYMVSKLRTPKQFFWLAVILLVVFLAGSNYFARHPEMMNGFIARFEDDTVESGGGRTEIFLLYMNAFLDNPRSVLMGTGVTQYKTQLGVVGSAHNGTQQILVCYGLVGFVVFMIALARPVLTAVQHTRGKRTFANWLPLISVVLFVQTIQFLNPAMLMLPYAIGIYALRAGGRKDEKLSDNSGYGRGQSLGLGTR